MWDGMFFEKRSTFTDHFDVVNIQEDSVFGIVHVTVVFDKTPNKEYVFDILAEDFEPDKESIGEEILRQLKS
jgi:hypothetical protein